MGFYFGLGSCYGFVLSRKMFNTLLSRHFSWLTNNWCVKLTDGQVLVHVPGSWQNIGGLDAAFDVQQQQRGYVSLNEARRLLSVCSEDESQATLNPQGQLRKQIDAMAAWCRVVAGPVACATYCCTLECPPSSSYGPVLPIVDDTCPHSPLAAPIEPTTQMSIVEPRDETHPDDLGCFAFRLPIIQPSNVAGLHEMD